MKAAELIHIIKNEKSLPEFFNLKPLILEYLESQEDILEGDN